MPRSIKPWPFLLGFGGGLLLPWAFLLHFVYGHTLIALITLSFASSVVFVGGLGYFNSRVRQRGGSSSRWLYHSTVVLVLFQASIGLALFSAYWYLRSQVGAWPPPGSSVTSSPVVSMLLLVLSSITVAMAAKFSRKGETSRFINLYLVTAVLWIVYAVITIVSWIELSSAGYGVDTNLFTLSFYCITGVHFAHLLFGLILLGLSIGYSFKRGLDDTQVQAMLIYAHFVNAFGIWGLPQLYL